MPTGTLTESTPTRMGEPRTLSLRAGRHAGRVRVTWRAGSSGQGSDRVAPFDVRVIWQNSEEAHVVLVPTMAMLLDGDDIGVRVVVDAGVRLRIVEVSGMVAYSGPGEGASYRSVIEVGSGGAVAWLAQPFVLAAGCLVTRTTEVTLGPGAAACLREILVLGRTGEAPGSAVIGTRIEDATGPLLIEQLEVGARHRLPGILGDAKVVDQTILAGVRPTHGHPDTLRLAGCGALNRRMAASAHIAADEELAEEWASLAFGAGHSVPQETSAHPHPGSAASPSDPAQEARKKEIHHARS